MAIIIDFEHYRKNLRPTDQELEEMHKERLMNEPFTTTHNEIQEMIRVVAGQGGVLPTPFPSCG